MRILLLFADIGWVVYGVCSVCYNMVNQSQFHRVKLFGQQVPIIVSTQHAVHRSRVRIILGGGRHTNTHTHTITKNALHSTTGSRKCIYHFNFYWPHHKANYNIYNECVEWWFPVRATCKTKTVNINVIFSYLSQKLCIQSNNFVVRCYPCTSKMVSNVHHITRCPGAQKKILLLHSYIPHYTASNRNSRIVHMYQYLRGAFVWNLFCLSIS